MASFLLCHQHKRQPLLLMFAVASAVGVAAGLYQDLFRPLGSLLFSDEQMAVDERQEADPSTSTPQTHSSTTVNDRPNDGSESPDRSDSRTTIEGLVPASAYAGFSWERSADSGYTVSIGVMVDTRELTLAGQLTVTVEVLDHAGQTVARIARSSGLDAQPEDVWIQSLFETGLSSEPREIQVRANLEPDSDPTHFRPKLRFFPDPIDVDVLEILTATRVDVANDGDTDANVSIECLALDIDGEILGGLHQIGSVKILARTERQISVRHSVFMPGAVEVLCGPGFPFNPTQLADVERVRAVSTSSEPTHEP